MALKKPMISMPLVVLCAAACGSHPAGPSEGGMDGAGTLLPGLRLGSGIFTQAIWEDGDLAYVVLNERDEDVSLTFSECESNDSIGGCTFGETMATWHLPRGSLRKIAGAEALPISSGDIVGASANGEKLGLLRPEVAPYASPLSVVSNADINSTSGIRENVGQVETDFVVAPAAAFTLELSLPVPGVLLLPPRTAPVGGLPFLDVLDARSAEAVVEQTEEGLRLDLLESASAESPVRVAVDVRYPEGFSGKLVGFDARFCTDVRPSGECSKSRSVQRAIPTEPPLP